MTSDELFLPYLGGLQKNFLNNILNDNTNQTNELNPIHISSYCDSNAFIALCKKKNCFSVIRSNIQSINAKFSEIEAFTHTAGFIQLHVTGENI